jgi:hypothetical protein
MCKSSHYSQQVLAHSDCEHHKPNSAPGKPIKELLSAGRTEAEIKNDICDIMTDVDPVVDLQKIDIKPQTVRVGWTPLSR